MLVAAQASADGGQDRGVKDLADLPVLCLATPIDMVIDDLDAAIELWDPCLADDFTLEFLVPGGAIMCPGPACPPLGSPGEMRATFAANNFANSGYMATQHQMLNVVVDRTGSGATVTGYIQANHFPGEGVVDMFWGDFTLDAIKERGRWKISKETINTTSFLRIEGTPPAP